MPREVTVIRYKCDTCHKEYKRLEDAEACERLHIPPLIVSIKRDEDEKGFQYPVRLIVAFSDGHHHYYKRES